LLNAVSPISKFVAVANRVIYDCCDAHVYENFVPGFYANLKLTVEKCQRYFSFCLCYTLKFAMLVRLIVSEHRKTVWGNVLFAIKHEDT